MASKSPFEDLREQVQDLMQQFLDSGRQFIESLSVSSEKMKNDGKTKFPPPPRKMERFTAKARRVLGLAQEEVERLGQRLIEPEHLLVALIQEDKGLAGVVLHTLTIELKQVQQLIAEMSQVKKEPGLIELSLMTKRLLEMSVDEARRMGHDYIGTEHLLLALIRQEDTIAIQILNRLNLTPMMIRRAVREELQKGAPADSDDTQYPFTGDVWTVLGNARLCTEHLQHAHVGPEHVLVGLIRTKNGVVEHVWDKFTVDRAQAEALVAALSDAEKRKPDHVVDLSLKTRELQNLALDEAYQLGHSQIGPEHFLLALAHQPDSVAVAILRQMDIDPEEVYQATRQAMSSRPPSWF